jgi:hypothetical protein
MKYFYIHPFKPQYFFPKEFKKHDLFLKFFIPYSLQGKISWFLFSTMALYRALFSKNNIGCSIPEASIRSIVGITPLMAFNLDFVPKVLDFYSDDAQVLLKTNVLKGERLSKTTLDQKIINQLITISSQKIECIKTTQSSLKTCFAHGDFCPWNMMTNNHNILIYDWEMAGNYTLGYDLFTFIFQTNFLLEPKKTITNILKENVKLIEHYFSKFNILNWNDYLIAFTNDKITMETLKGTKGMFTQYSNLLAYAKKA